VEMRQGQWELNQKQNYEEVKKGGHSATPKQGVRKKTQNLTVRGEQKLFPIVPLKTG